MSGNCNVCMEPYHRGSNPAYTCNPCGHVTCQPCLDTWFFTNRRTCPECRTRVTTTTINRPLMDVLENTTQTNQLIQPTQPNQPNNRVNQEISDSSCSILGNNICQHSPKNDELIIDKCQYSVYVIDNSGSMDGYYDGKTYQLDRDCRVVKQANVVRWEEAVSKTLQIAEYNIVRNMSASYYLLNPQSGEWKQGIDYITIHPDQLNRNEKREIINTLRKALLQSSNIRGTTPLDRVTQYFRNSLEDIVGNVKHPICYNIITDGEPNDKLSFERQIRQLCQRFQIFLVINLCTDNDDIINYYNDLDTTIGNELSGMDVLDDLESEANEVWQVGNRFITYSLEIHICRMAGCFSVISDWMDEIQLDVHYVDKLIREITGTTERLDITRYQTSSNEYFAYIDSLNNRHPPVYDIRTKQFTPIINKYWLRFLLLKKTWLQIFGSGQINQTYYIGTVCIALLLLVYLLN